MCATPQSDTVFAQPLAHAQAASARPMQLKLGITMIKQDLITAALGIVVFAYAAAAQPSLPSAFKSQIVASPEGADIFVRSAGSGPVVILLHGYAETSDSWAPLAAELVKTYTVVVPDLRGIGHSSRPAGG